jgi:PIN domain nuclease of toxin-antitoxin system
MKTYILDACAIIALIYKENGYEIIAKIYEKAISKEISLLMHRLNLLEVYNKIAQHHDLLHTNIVYNKIQKSPIEFIDNLDDNFFQLVISLKQKYKISLVDSFVVSTSILRNGTVITADHDFDEIEKDNKIKFLWFR